MHRLFNVAVVVFMSLAAPALAADTYKVDPVHSMAIFRSDHANVGHVWGRFNEPTGTFVYDAADPTKSTFEIELTVDKIDTNNEKRDGHLKSPDFFNAKQYPTITFKSTSVSKGDGDALNVTGDLTMHGVTKQITIPVEVLGTGEFPPGTTRTGLEAKFPVKMSEYEIKGLPGAVGDEIHVIVAVEGIKQ